MTDMKWHRLNYTCGLIVLVLATFWTGVVFTIPFGVANGQSGLTVPFQLGQAEQIAINSDRLTKLELQQTSQDKQIAELTAKVSMIQGVGMAIGVVTAVLSALGLIAKHKP